MKCFARSWLELTDTTADPHLENKTSERFKVIRLWIRCSTLNAELFYCSLRQIKTRARRGFKPLIWLQTLHQFVFVQKIVLSFMPVSAEFVLGYIMSASPAALCLTQLLQELFHPFLQHATRWPAVQLLGCQQWQTAESTRGCSCSRPCPTVGGVILLIQQQSVIKSLKYNVKWLQSGLPGDLTVLTLHTTLSALLFKGNTLLRSLEKFCTQSKELYDPQDTAKKWHNFCHLCGLPWDKRS